jgi:hypothetical protein
MLWCSELGTRVPSGRFQYPLFCGSSPTMIRSVIALRLLSFVVIVFASEGI